MNTPGVNGFTWRKSSYSSTGDSGSCVEVGAGSQFVGIRDTKNRALGQLTIAPNTWRAFITSRYVAGS